MYTGIPDMRELQEGDIVNIDVSVYYNGYHADLNETYFVGISKHIWYTYYIHVCILYTCMYTLYMHFFTTNDDGDFVGNCDEDSIRLVKAAYEALGAAIALVKPGCLYK